MSFEYEEIYCDDIDQGDGSESNSQKKVRYLQKYKKEWENDYKFKDWLEPIQNDPYAAYCNVCCSSLTARKKDLMDHADTRKHKKNLVYKQNNPLLYQKMMQNIREVDASVIMDKSVPWHDEAIKCLITQVESQHDHFYDTNIKKSTLFTIISNEMNRAGFQVVPSECQRKWESLRKSYERVLQYQVRGEFKSRFPYFNLIHRFLAKDIDPTGMREKMLAKKLGRVFDPTAPLILDGNLDGTLYTTTLVATATKKDPTSVRINNCDDNTTEITISSLDDDGQPSHLGLDVEDIELEEMEATSDLEEGQILPTASVKMGTVDAVEMREWEEGAVDVLLTVMNQINFSPSMMQARGQFHESFWEKVSTDLLDFYCEVSAFECRHKWRQLLAQYKQLFELQQQQASHKRGKQAWLHFDAVGKILEKIHKVKLPDTPRFKRSLSDARPGPPNKKRFMRTRGRGRGGHTSFRSRPSHLAPPTGGGAQSTSNAALIMTPRESSRQYKGTRKGIELALMGGKQIKQERQEDDLDEVDESMVSDVLEHDEQDGEDDDGTTVAEPKLKMKRMQSSLMLVTQRIEMLEREVAKKNETRQREDTSSIYGPQIVSLLTNILGEMKQFNANRNGVDSVSFSNEVDGLVSNASACDSNGADGVQHMNFAEDIKSVIHSSSSNSRVNSLERISLSKGLCPDALSASGDGSGNSNTVKAAPGVLGGAEGVVKMAGDGKMHVSLADGTIAVPAETYFRKS